MALTDRMDLRGLADDLGPRYAALRQAAEMYADHQKLRIVSDNRIRSLTVDAADYSLHSEMLHDLEKGLSRNLIRIYREVVPAGVLEWQASDAARGIGEHMLARLLGHLGHPRLATPKYWARNSTIAESEWGTAENPKRMLVDDAPYLRTLAQLRSYCGHGEARHRRAGMTQEDAFALGSPKCKMLVHLISEAVVKTQVRNGDDGKYALGELGQLYLDTRTRYAERGHSGPCPGGFVTVGKRVVRVKCKVDGRYADAGDPFQPSHLNAIALRHVGKRVLADLYDAAREEWC